MRGREWPAPLTSRVGGFLAQPAVRAVADVEADQLIAAAALAQVHGRGADPKLTAPAAASGHRLEPLAGLAVDVDAAGLGGDERLAAGGRGPYL